MENAKGQAELLQQKKKEILEGIQTDAPALGITADDIFVVCSHLLAGEAPSKNGLHGPLEEERLMAVLRSLPDTV